MQFSSLPEKGPTRVLFAYRGNHPRAREKNEREGDKNTKELR